MPAPQPDGSEPRVPRYLYVMFAACGALWMAWVIGLLLGGWLGLGGGWQVFSQFGDAFGALNALFTALAFAAFWWSGWMQQQELRLQRMELRNQQAELASTREVFQRQTFETAFFNQLELFRNISASLRVDDLVGQAAMEHVAREMSRFVLTNDFPDGDVFREKVAQKFRMEFYSPHEAQLGPYFRTLYLIFKLISRQDYMSEAERVEYANIARGQLGTDALVALAVNALTPQAQKFVQLIEAYGVLKHLPVDDARRVLFAHSLGPTAFLGTRERAALNRSG